jgi:WD40 repeat protein
LYSLTAHKKDVKGVAFSPYGNTLATGSADQTIIVWNAHTGTQILTITDPGGGINWLVFSPDGKYALTGDQDNTALQCLISPLLNGSSMTLQMLHHLARNMWLRR